MLYCENGKQSREKWGRGLGPAPDGKRRGEELTVEPQGDSAAGSDPVVVDFLALATFLVTAARAQALARQDGDYLLGRRAGRQLVADAIGHHRQARALPAQRLGDRAAAFVAVAIPFIADSLAITALFHPNSLTRLREWSRAWRRTDDALGG